MGATFNSLMPCPSKTWNISTQLLDLSGTINKHLENGTAERTSRWSAWLINFFFILKINFHCKYFNPAERGLRESSSAEGDKVPLKAATLHIRLNLIQNFFAFLKEQYIYWVDDKRHWRSKLTKLKTTLMGRKKKINDQKSPQKQSHKQKNCKRGAEKRRQRKRDEEEVNAMVNCLVNGVIDMEQKDARAQLAPTSFQLPHLLPLLDYPQQYHNDLLPRPRCSPPAPHSWPPSCQAAQAGGGEWSSWFDWDRFSGWVSHSDNYATQNPHAQSPTHCQRGNRIILERQL